MATKSILVSAPGPRITGSVQLPTSKSISNRLLMIRALSELSYPIEGLSEADDTQLMIRLLAQVERTGGSGRTLELDAQNAGTVMRFLTAMLAMRPGRWVMTGTERMKQRPIGLLVDALRTLGASIEYLAKPGYPPLLIKGQPLRGGEVPIHAGESSQYVSALLMIAPLLPGGLTLRLKGHAVSEPYIRMTVALMKEQGISIRNGKTVITVKPGRYRATSSPVEADWSAAAFWYEVAALSQEADIELKGLLRESLQGDSVVAELFGNFGVRTTFIPGGVRLTRSRNRVDGFFYDFTGHPDISLPVITTCATFGIRGHFEGLQSLRIKETDRLRALKNEIEKLGVRVEISGPREEMATLRLEPGVAVKSLLHPFETYQDHRMAMIFAPLALRFGSVRITHPEVVAKSYPAFWEHMAGVGFSITP